MAKKWDTLREAETQMNLTSRMRSTLKAKMWSQCESINSAMALTSKIRINGGSVECELIFLSHSTQANSTAFATFFWLAFPRSRVLRTYLHRHFWTVPIQM